MIRRVRQKLRLRLAEYRGSAAIPFRQYYLIEQQNAWVVGAIGLSLVDELVETYALL